MVDLAKKKAFIMVGYPGSGKSTLAKKIANVFNCSHLTSDYFRQKISGQTRYDSVGDKAGSKQSARAYKLMYKEAAELIANNKAVVLDATHLVEAKRKRVISDLLQTCPKDCLCFVTVNTPYEVINERMSAFNDVENEGKYEEREVESLYQAWKRIYGYFENRKKNGQISWPNKEEGIDIVTYEEIQSHLA